VSECIIDDDGSPDLLDVPIEDALREGQDLAHTLREPDLQRATHTHTHTHTHTVSQSVSQRPGSHRPAYERRRRAWVWVRVRVCVCECGAAQTDLLDEKVGVG
jgi:hypothetical protein